MVKNKTLAQKIAKSSLKKVPVIPKEYFSRAWVPAPFLFNGKPENKKHYRYKIFLGETLRDNLPFLDIKYEFKDLPSFYNARHNKFVNYYPDIWIEWHDEGSKVSFFSDIEINGLIHYKNKEQILKMKERMNHIYPLMQVLKAADKPDYRTIASYIILDKDDFEYTHISDIYADIRNDILRGGIYPVDFDKILENLLAVAV